MGHGSIKYRHISSDAYVVCHCSHPTLCFKSHHVYAYIGGDFLGEKEY